MLILLDSAHWTLQVERRSASRIRAARPFAGLTYDGVEYAVNAAEASTTGSGYSFKIVTTDADGIIESYEELATDGD